MDIGSKIKLARKIRGLSQSELAEKLKMTKQAVSLIEKNKIKISDSLLQKVSKILKKTVDYFINDDFKEIKNDVKEKEKKDLGKRLRVARVEIGLNQTEMAEKIGMSQVGYNHYELNETEPSLDTLKKISEITKKSLDYFIGEDKSEINKLIIPSDKFIYIPLYGDVGAGKPVERLDQIPIETLIPIPVHDKRIKGALKVISDSMEPRIKKGDYVYIDNETMISNDDIAVIYIRDKGTIIKQINFLQNNKIKLVPCNPKYEECIYKLEDVNILGKVVGITSFSF